MQNLIWNELGVLIVGKVLRIDNDLILTTQVDPMAENPFLTSHMCVCVCV